LYPTFRDSALQCLNKIVDVKKCIKYKGYSKPKEAEPMDQRDEEQEELIVFEAVLLFLVAAMIIWVVVMTVWIGADVL
jgi:hypothetical protein